MKRLVITEFELVEYGGQARIDYVNAALEEAGFDMDREIVSALGDTGVGFCFSQREKGDPIK